MTKLSVNGQIENIEVPDNMPLLWALRDVLGLVGTKFGCGVGLCGACTVHVDGEPHPACQVLIEEVDGRNVTTIDGISNPIVDVVRMAWNELNVVQCGYCQPGQIMQTVALLGTNPHPSDADIDAVFDQNLCRCGTYPRIREAIHRAAFLAEQSNVSR